MAQATYSYRMDSDLKSSFDEVCNDFGMNSTTMINILAKQVVRKRKVPFEITAERREPNLLDMDTLTDEELIKELDASYAESESGKGAPVEEVFEALHKEYGF